MVQRALAHAKLEHQVEALQGRLEQLGETDAARSRNPAMLDQMERCRRAAATDATVAAARRYHKPVRPIDGVICIAAAVPLTVATVAEALGLPGISVETARLSQDKLAMKRCFAARERRAVRDVRTQVGIVGAGPAGLTLARLLENAGIESVILEARSREYCEARIRAGVLEQGVVDLLAEAGGGARLVREGPVHHGISLQLDRERDAVERAEPGVLHHHLREVPLRFTFTFWDYPNDFAIWAANALFALAGLAMLTNMRRVRLRWHVFQDRLEEMGRHFKRWRQPRRRPPAAALRRRSRSRYSRRSQPSKKTAPS